MPFNSWEGISVLGEYYRDSCILFFLLAFFIILFKKKIKLPLHSPIFYSLIVFYGECELKKISNIPDGTMIVKSKKSIKSIK